MIDLSTFKKRCGVTKNRYIEEWINEGLIPGARRGPSIEDIQFPDSARRPYRYRAKIKHDTNNIRAHILNACIRREYISSEMCHMSKDEFDMVINDLIACGLISIRIEDKITYYDASVKCESIDGKRLRSIRKFIMDALEAVSRGCAEGILS